MAGKTFSRLVGGLITTVTGIQTSAGAGNAGDIPALDATGKLDPTMMPTGIVPDVVTLVTSDNMTPGQYVNIYNNSGVPTARLADASVATAGKECHGFASQTTTQPATNVIYLPGSNNGLVAGQVAGDVYLSRTTPGAGTATPPSTSGDLVQKLGVATSATSVAFDPVIVGTA